MRLFHINFTLASQIPSTNSGQPPSRSWLVILSIGLFIQIAGLLLIGDGSRYATQVHLFLLLPSLLLMLQARLNLNLWRQLPAFALLGLMAWLLLNAILRPDAGEHSLGYWLKIVLFITLYIFAVSRLTQQPRALLMLLRVCGAIAALFAWLTLIHQFGIKAIHLDYATIRDDARLYTLDWQGLADLNHPIIAGLYYGVFIIVLSHCLISRSRRAWQSGLLLLAIAGLVIYVLLTFSRGAWFATAGAGLCILLLYPNRRSHALLLMGVILLVCMLVIFWPHVHNEWVRGTSRRDLIWLSWLDRLPEFWLWGEGPGAPFNFTYPWTGSVKHAHSLYLQLWYQLGLPGILLFIALIVSLLQKGWRLRKQPLARLSLALFILGLIGMLTDIHSVFLRPQPYWVIFWLPAGMLLGLQEPAPEIHTPPCQSQLLK